MATVIQCDKCGRIVKKVKNGLRYVLDVECVGYKGGNYVEKSNNIDLCEECYENFLNSFNQKTEKGE